MKRKSNAQTLVAPNELVFDPRTSLLNDAYNGSKKKKKKKKKKKY